MQFTASLAVLFLLSSLASAAPSPSVRRASVAEWDLDWDTPNVGYDLDATVDFGVELIAQVAKDGAKVVAFPETWVPGYPKGYDQNDWMFKHVDSCIENSLVVNSTQWQQFVDAASSNEVYVALGFSERAGDHNYMAQALFGPDGEVLIHRHKLRPSGSERDLWSDGTKLQVVSTPIGRISLLECWEPATTLPIQAQSPDLRIGPFPYNPQINDTDALWFEDVGTNLAAARIFVINSGAVTVSPGIGGSAIYAATGVKFVESQANDDFQGEPIIFASVNATAFANVTYNSDSEQSWGIVEQVEAAIPAYIPRNNQGHVVLSFFSAAYWSDFTASLASSLGDTFTPQRLTVGEVITGLPLLSAASPSSAKPLLRAIAAIGISTLLDARGARLRPQEPTTTSPAPTALAAKAIIALSCRLA
ncbi:hypothetical protein JCM11641_005479 [Rhodosporidiobolus odoratus]